MLTVTEEMDTKTYKTQYKCSFLFYTKEGSTSANLVSSGSTPKEAVKNLKKQIERISKRTLESIDRYLKE